MFKKYGLIGILLIILVEINFFLKMEPLASWYFPLIWFGYILTIDALVYKIKDKSLITNRFPQFIGMLIISSLFWWTFEFFNLSINNWSYVGTESISRAKSLFGTIALSTVLPALFETVELIRSIHLFDKIRLKKKYKIKKSFLHTLTILGIICFFAPIFLPSFAFPLVWLSFFLILDPINYLHKQPSIIGHLKDKKLLVPLSLLLAGIILGFLWEFWNYWAIIKCKYNIPFLGFFKIFEMPILGYFGYFPFAFELYSMYWFVRSLFIHKERLLVE